MNGVMYFDKTDSICSLAAVDDLIRFGGWKVKVTAGRQGQIVWTPVTMNYLSSLDGTHWD